MKHTKHIFLVLTLVVLWGCSAGNKDLTSKVNPFIGTVGSGNTFLGVVAPYGMAQLGPWHSYAKDGKTGTLHGFSHTHVSGMAGGGNTPRGHVVFMPVKPGAEKYSSSFSHSNEVAHPECYSVHLDDFGIKAELTGTTRAGMHRYTFDGKEGAVVLKLGNGTMDINGDEVSGTDGGVYFYAKFSKPVKSVIIKDGGKEILSKQNVHGNNVNAVFGFDTSDGKPVLLKVGISMVSTEGAKKNVETEIPGWDFEKVKSAIRKEWNKELGKIVVEGGTDTEQAIFYTSLYHSMIHPNIYMDVDGKFRSTNGKIYTAEGYSNYTNFSLWDTFRALHPLYTIINRERTNEFIRTFLERYDHAGRMLIMEFNGVEGDVPPMIAYHSLSVLADAYVKGIRDYDVKKAFKAMKYLANDLDRKGKQLYLDYGFIPADLKGQSVSRTLEYCYDDWCVTRLAKDFNEDDLRLFEQRGDFYKNLFNKKYNFMVGRRSNFKWVGHFDPMETVNHYTEANAYQYSTFVPHHMDGLIDLMGGDKVFEKWLDKCFTTETDFSKINVRDVTGLIGQYAHGNEPSHSIAYLYDFAGTPWKTQKMVRRIMSELYGNSQGGIDGNEDCGQMSAWYVLSTMGIYQVTPGLDYFVIGSPLFDKVTINLENGKKFVIRAKNNGKDNVYIQSAKLNGNDYTKSFLKYGDIIKGGKIEFVMGSQPQKSWGSADKDQPHTPGNEFEYASMPVPAFEDILFLDRMPVTLGTVEKGGKVYYTLDGSDVTQSSIPYTGTITITKPTVLKCRTFVDGKYPSYQRTVHFRQIAKLMAVKNPGTLRPGVIYLYREGPKVMCARDQAGAPVVDKGVLKNFNVDKIKDDRPFGYNLYGYIKVPATGVYTFYLEANDGAILYINGKEIIDNDGGHRSQVLDSKIWLQKGIHPIKVDYFQQGLAKNLILEWEGPGVKKQEVPASVLFHKKE